MVTHTGLGTEGMGVGVVIVGVGVVIVGIGEVAGVCAGSNGVFVTL